MRKSLRYLVVAAIVFAGTLTYAPKAHPLPGTDVTYYYYDCDWNYVGYEYYDCYNHYYHSGATYGSAFREEVVTYCYNSELVSDVWQRYVFNYGYVTHSGGYQVGGGAECRCALRGEC